MLEYLVRRLLLMLVTLFGITVVVFIVINLAPGSPVEQKLHALRFGGGNMAGTGSTGHGSSFDKAVSDTVVEALKKQYGFDKPMHVRYWIWLKNLSRLDFGESFSYEEPVIDVIVSKFPVSIQFGIVSFFLTYIVCIPLGVFKAIRKGSAFDLASSFALFVLYSIPPFMLGILLIVYFAGGSFFNFFPIGGLYSDGYESLSFMGKMWDRLHHFILPLICYMIGSFTTLTLLMRNSLIEEISKDYCRTARAKGLDEMTVYWKHALRNALIPIATGIGSFLSIFFAGSMLLESIFQLDGIGLLSYTSVLARDYNVIMGLVFIESVLFLVGNIVSDFAYVLVDPRIDFK